VYCGKSKNVNQKEIRDLRIALPCPPRTAAAKLVTFPGSSDEELYDLTSDPYELQNLAGRAGVGGGAGGDESAARSGHPTDRRAA